MRALDPTLCQPALGSISTTELTKLLSEKLTELRPFSLSEFIEDPYELQSQGYTPRVYTTPVPVPSNDEIENYDEDYVPPLPSYREQLLPSLTPQPEDDPELEAAKRASLEEFDRERRASEARSRKSIKPHPSEKPPRSESDEDIAALVASMVDEGLDFDASDFLDDTSSSPLDYKTLTPEWQNIIPIELSDTDVTSLNQLYFLVTLQEWEAIKPLLAEIEWKIMSHVFNLKYRGDGFRTLFHNKSPLAYRALITPDGK